MAYKEYDLKGLTVAIGGTLAGGFADGEFLVFRPNKERSNLTVGADGEGARSKLYDFSAQIDLNLLQTSYTNEILSAYAKANSTFSFGLIDTSGTSVIAAVNCWVRSMPEVSYSSEITERKWVLETDEAEVFVGSN